jgi:hypothetical protein
MPSPRAPVASWRQPTPLAVLSKPKAPLAVDPSPVPSCPNTVRIPMCTQFITRKRAQSAPVTLPAPRSPVSFLAGHPGSSTFNPADGCNRRRHSHTTRTRRPSLAKNSAEKRIPVLHFPSRRAARLWLRLQPDLVPRIDVQTRQNGIRDVIHSPSFLFLPPHVPRSWPGQI